MSNSRKRLLRALMEQHGISYQAAHNMLAKNEHLRAKLATPGNAGRVELIGEQKGEPDGSEDVR